MRSRKQRLINESINGYFFYDMGKDVFVIEDMVRTFKGNKFKNAFLFKKSDLFSKDPNWDAVERLIDICICRPEEIETALNTLQDIKEDDYYVSYIFGNGICIMEYVKENKTVLIDLDNIVYELIVKKIK